MGDLISVIIPCYNVEKYIDRCMESVLNQTYRKLEIILVDDGSTDGTGKICDRYSQTDARVKVIHKENGGLSSARNAGLDICQGEYIFFVDSDDWITIDAVQYLYDLRKKYNADFSMAAYVRTRANEKRDCLRHDYMECELTQLEFLSKLFKIGTQENVQFAWAKLYKSELFDNIQYPAGVIFEDVPTTFHIAVGSGKIAYSSHVIYYYYVNPNSITEENFNDRKFDLIKVWDMVCEKACQNTNEWILAQAIINRKRADFGVLMKLAISNITLKEKQTYLLKAKKNISDLKKNAGELYRSKIPFSRKIFIACFSINYPICLRILHCISLIKFKLQRCGTEV